MKRLPVQLLFILCIASVLGNIILGSFIAVTPRAPRTDAPTSALINQFPYLSPRIFAENQNDIRINFINLRSQLQAYVGAIPYKIGVYFEYLPSGTSIGLNEKTEYVLASLLKVPVAMAALAAVNEGTLSPTQILTIQESQIDPHFGTLWQKRAGYQLSLQNAIDIMLKQSDNTAARVIFDALPAGAVEKIFDQLDIPKVLDKDQPVVTPKNYSSILKSLYLSAILPKNDSNEILNILTQTEYNDRIAAGVPQGIQVAHKIGVHTNPQLATSIFTDCGIIYIPHRPYTLCVMVQSPEADAVRYMKDLSKLVYTYVSSFKTN